MWEFLPDGWMLLASLLSLGTVDENTTTNTATSSSSSSSSFTNSELRAEAQRHAERQVADLILLCCMRCCTWVEQNMWSRDDAGHTFVDAVAAQRCAMAMALWLLHHVQLSGEAEAQRMAKLREELWRDDDVDDVCQMRADDAKLRINTTPTTFGITNATTIAWVEEMMVDVHEMHASLAAAAPSRRPLAVLLWLRASLSPSSSSSSSSFHITECIELNECINLCFNIFSLGDHHDDDHDHDDVWHGPPLFSTPILVDECFFARVWEVMAHLGYAAARLTMMSIIIASSRTHDDDGPTTRKKKKKQDDGRTGFVMEMACRRAWRCALPHVRMFVVRASDAAHVAVAVYGASPDVERWSRHHLRTVLFGSRTANKLCQLHDHVQISANTHGVMDGVGLMAAKVVEEGEVLVMEVPLLHWMRGRDDDDVGDGGGGGGGTSSSRAASLANDVVECVRSAEAILASDAAVVQRIMLGRDRSTSTQDDDDDDGPCWFGGGDGIPLVVTDYLRLLAQLPCTTTNNNNTSSSCVYGEEHLVEELLQHLSTSEENHTIIPISAHVDVFRVHLQTNNVVDGATRWSRLSELEVGCGSYFVLQMINHSCQPNAFLRAERSYNNNNNSNNNYDLGMLVLLATRRIEAGEEIHVCYLSNPLITRAEKQSMMGFACKCWWCQHKGPIMDGILCSECGMLVQPPTPSSSSSTNNNNNQAGVVAHSRGMDAATAGVRAFQHEAPCSASSTSMTAALAVVDRLRAQLVEMEDAFLHNTLPSTWNAAQHTDPTTMHAHPSSSSSSTSIDVASEVVRRMMCADECSSTSILPTHALRLRLRQEMMAAAISATHLNAMDHGKMMTMAAMLLQDVQLLLAPNHPLLTGLRMVYVYLLSRDSQQLQQHQHQHEDSANHVAHADCCGAVRAEMDLLRRPFLHSALMRACIIVSFQEHYIQCCTTNNFMETYNNNNHDDDDDVSQLVLRSFLRRFDVELAAAGVETPDHIDMISMMGDDTNNNNNNNEDDDHHVEAADVPCVRAVKIV